MDMCIVTRRAERLRAFAAAVLTVGTVTALQGQPQNPPAAPPPASLPTLDNVKVTAVARSPETADRPVEAGIRDIIVLTVANAKDLVNRSRCIGTDGKPVAGCREQTISLYLDGREIKGLLPESIDLSTNTLQFHIERGTVSDEAWADLLGAPPLDHELFYRRPTAISVGLADTYGVASDVQKPNFNLIRIHKSWFIVCSIVLLGVLVLLFWLILDSEILRDTGPVPTGRTRGWIFSRKKHKPYSLARFQMAFWFILIVTSFLFIWLVTNAVDTITASALALIGIGAGTFLSAMAIDAGNAQSEKARVVDLSAELDALTADVADLDAKIAAVTPPPNVLDLQQMVNSKQARLVVVKTDLAKLTAAAQPKESNGFLNDILTDESNGISFHRFQMFVWTLVLGVLFLYSVWNRLSMPEFSAMLLGLLGISDGTYLGFKIPENQK
jgi:hypothetical protein